MFSWVISFAFCTCKTLRRNKKRMFDIHFVIICAKTSVTVSHGMIMPQALIIKCHWRVIISLLFCTMIRLNCFALDSNRFHLLSSLFFFGVEFTFILIVLFCWMRHIIISYKNSKREKKRTPRRKLSRNKIKMRRRPVEYFAAHIVKFSVSNVRKSWKQAKKKHVPINHMTRTWIYFKLE